MQRRSLLRFAALCALKAGPLSSLHAATGRHLKVGAILPLGGPSAPEHSHNLSQTAESARQGVVFGEEEMQRNAALFGHHVELLLSNAPGAAAAARAAHRLVVQNQVQVLIGGFTPADAAAISRVAQQAGVLFLNIGASSDSLRGQCGGHTFHIEASAAMYLDALAGWFVRAGHRRWFLIHGAGDEQQSRLARATDALGNRLWGGKIVGDLQVQGEDFEAALAAIKAAKPDAVLVLNDWLMQLKFLSRYSAEGLTYPVANFPEAATQTREFYVNALQSAPQAGAGHRAALWEPTLDAYGARELNARAASRWGRPMDSITWAAYQAMKIAFEAFMLSPAADGTALAGYLSNRATVLDVHKGIGVSFRPWDNQLRQSLYLVKLNSGASAARDLAALKDRAGLVGELPAIYMPGTDPVERLDQLGDLNPQRECHT